MGAGNSLGIGLLVDFPVL